MILIGVSSSIGAYKAVELSKLLEVEKNFILTQNTLKLIDKKDFEKFGSVYTDMFRKDFDYRKYLKDNKKIDHINLSDNADLIIVVPATANIIGKLANGIADDLLTTTFLACNCQKIIAPAMNCKMWENDIVQDNIKKLKKSGVEIIEPARGMLACGYEGVGKLQDINKIKEIIEQRLVAHNDLEGMKILITAGPTQEEIDPVRYISNRSSGKMGYAIAKAARQRGAKVTLVSGPTELVPPFGIYVIDVKTADEMLRAVMENRDCDVFIGAAAVADYRVEKSEEKIKKKEFIDLRLEKTPDIIYEFSRLNGRGKIVGFALETNNILENARKKLLDKKLDLIIANSTQAFGSDENEVVLISSKKEVKLKGSKFQIANKLLDYITKSL